MDRRLKVTAQRAMGKTVIVGITQTNPAGEVLSQVQYVGRFAGLDDVIHITLDPAGEDVTLPPALASFKWAKPGIYRLRSDGREVENPDLVTSWTVQAPKRTRKIKKGANKASEGMPRKRGNPQG